MADHKRNVLVYIIELLQRSHLVWYWLPVFIWMAGIFYLSSRSNPSSFLPSSGHSINIDRLAHIAEYTGLAALLYRALRKQGDERDFSAAPSHLCTPVLIALAYAVLDELHQELVPGRSFELADIGYDLAGIIVAVGLIWVRKTK
jgi:VanZ family protein